MPAENDLPNAQNNLGTAYYTGKGIHQDYQKAVYWWKKSAHQGYAEAQYNLGVAYYNGKGVLQNDLIAIQWFRKAADAGNAKAQYSLGFASLTGKGASRNLQQAVHWFRRAARQDLPEALYALGTIYANASNNPDSKIAAYLLLNRAAQIQTEAEEALKTLENEMTPEQIARARSLTPEEILH
jgi:hypothetical protein